MRSGGAVSDGRALVEAAARLRPEVIILDISLPTLNGIDAARQIKKESSRKQKFYLLRCTPILPT